MGTEEGGVGVRRARQNALLRRQVAESAIASHGGSKRNVMAILTPRTASSFSAKVATNTQAYTERQDRPIEAKSHKPSGALSARGREVISPKSPTRTDKADSATSTLSTKRTSVDSIISHSREMRQKGPVIQQQSILPRVTVHRGPLSPRGAGLAMKARPESNPGASDTSESGQAEKGGLRRSNSRNRMTFGAFRQHKVVQEVLPLVPPTLKVQEPEEDRVKRLLKRFAFSGEEEVKRVMGYYRTALERYCDPEDVQAELLPIQGLKSWICQFSGIAENQPLGHLLDPEWSKDTCLSEDEFLAWYNSHQWNEEIMVPDPLERRVRHFCKNEGYHISDVERVKAAFEKADKDSSGLLDQQEFAACYAGLAGVDPSEVVESKFRILWEEVDEDHNGAIDLLEFAKWYLRVNPPLGRGAVKAF